MQPAQEVTQFIAQVLVAAQIGDSKRLLISPDGALNLIPLDALLDPSGAALIDRFEFFNLGRGELVELNLVLDTLQELLGKKVLPCVLRPGPHITNQELLELSSALTTKAGAGQVFLERKPE